MDAIDVRLTKDESGYDGGAWIEGDNNTNFAWKLHLRPGQLHELRVKLIEASETLGELQERQAE